MSESQAPAPSPSDAAPPLVAARARLDALGALGATCWDGPGLGLVERLLDAAAQHEASLGTQLLGRALDHLAQLESDFATAQERAERARGRLAAQGRAPEQLQTALGNGQLAPLLRAVRRTPSNRPRLRDELRDGMGQQLDAQARARGISSPGLIEAPRMSSSAPLELATSLYRDSVAGATARITLAKTAAAVPQDAGRYHPLQIGARTLQTAAGYPAYMKALLARLETLGVLWQHGLDE